MLSNFEHFSLDEPVSVCLCVCVRVSLSLRSDSSETVEATIIKLGTVSPSDMRMHHMLIMLTLTFIQGHTDVNHEKNKCFIISETIQASNAHQVCCEDNPTMNYEELTWIARIHSHTFYQHN